MMLADSGALKEFVRAGARILESACGPCIGLGFSPGQGTVSLRTFNRNFVGRSGTKDDKVYLVSPETAVAAAVTGEVTDPRRLNSLGIEYRPEPMPEKFLIDDSLLVAPLPEAEGRSAEIVRGSTIVKPPSGSPLPPSLAGKVLIKVGDKITTDHIMPAGTFLKFRSNVPEYAKVVFNQLNESGQPTFYQRASALRDTGRHGVILAGDSYGQGSSREHAALCPMYLGVRAVIAKAIERIHKANLVNFGITPLLLADPKDYDRIDPDDELQADGFLAAIKSDASKLTVRNITKGFDFACQLELTDRERRILTAGGKLQLTSQP